jgi:arylsulfatase A-like enzyme
MNKYFSALFGVFFVFFPNRVECQEKKPNLFLITIDTLRTDHLHAYGYHRETSPTLDRLSQEGVLFENASTVSTRTTQSLAAMITGRYPQTIGVRALHEKLKANEVTLAEILKQHGYHTGMVISNAIVRNSNIEQGFDFSIITPKRELALKSNELFLSWLKKNKNQPVFGWIHYEDPHIPYRAPEEFRNRFDPDYRGIYEEKFSFSIFPNYIQEADRTSFKAKLIFNHVRLSPKDLRRIQALYDAEIAYTDMAIAKLLEEMKSLGVMDNTLVVISSDHGESLVEHQYFFEHGDFVYEATMKVPLIFHWPSKILPGQRFNQSVRTIDILPTILSLLDIPDPPAGCEGKNLAGVVLGEEVIGNLPVYTESGESFFLQHNPRRYIQGVRGKIRALREGKWKLIFTPTESEAILELYNLNTDPSETQNLVEKEPKRARKMAQNIQDWMKKGEYHIIPPRTKKTRKHLLSLGYLQ